MLGKSWRFIALFASLALGASLMPHQAVRAQQPGPATAPPALVTYRGAAGKSFQGPFALNAGLTVLRAKHNGTGYFGVSLSLPAAGATIEQAKAEANYTDTFLVYNSTEGGIDDGAAVIVAYQGNYYLDVDASGAYQVSVEQPLPATVTPVVQTTFTGKSQQVTAYFTLPGGTVTVSGQSSSGYLRAWLYSLDDLGGSAVTSGVNVYDGRLIDTTFPPGTTSYTFDLPAGTYLFYVLPGTGDSWTMTIQ